MSLKAHLSKHVLKFKTPVKTSRGEYNDRIIYFLNLYNPSLPEIIGVGECAPLKGLSIDDVENYEEILNQLIIDINENDNKLNLDFSKYPSIKFGLETALLDLKNGGKKIIFKNFYSIGKQGISINGLIWMNSFETMLEEIKQKLKMGFTCLKLKIGSLDFDQEVKLIEYIHQNSNVDIRLDANGAFKHDDVFEKLNILKSFRIHSIEQPVKAKQWDLMKDVINKSPLSIALDEELIGLNTEVEINLLFKELKPQFIVLKPNLLGGFIQTEKWIAAAEKNKINWWLTSALESNIGLNAISQFAANNQNKLPQGLGTGHLYTNNVMPFTLIKEGCLWRNMGGVASDE